jgi:hypothetical protein
MLIATVSHTTVRIRSRSPLPVVISANSGYRQSLRRWTALPLGGTAVRIVATGRRYGYCFSQAGGDGYAATRGCGTLVMHEYLNGTALPDGTAIADTFQFTGR